MLRTCNPGGVHAPPLLKSHADSTDNIRRQIVDMVRISERKGQAVIYDLHRGHGVKVQPFTELDPNRLENIGKSDQWQSGIRKLPSRGRQPRNQQEYNRQQGGVRQNGKENRDSTTTLPPKLPPRNSSLLQKSAKQSREMPQSTYSHVQPKPTSQDSFKRSRSGLASQKQTAPKPKNIRQKTEDINSPYQSTSSSSPSDEKTGSRVSGGQLCQIRGSAISTQKTNARAASPIKREEVKKRASRFSASLDFFRRRLKMNQSKYLSPDNNANSESYVIRKDDIRNSSCKQKIDLRFVPRPPSTAKTTNHKSTSANDSNETKETRFSYRLPEVENDEESQEVTLGEMRTLPQVGTYVLEDDDVTPVVANQEPAPLTLHNVEIHNMFMDARAKKYKITLNDDVTYDFRLLRWIDDSNTQKHQKIVTFEMPLPATDRVDTSTPPMSKPRHHKWNDVI